VAYHRKPPVRVQDFRGFSAASRELHACQGITRIDHERNVLLSSKEGAFCKGIPWQFASPRCQTVTMNLPVCWFDSR
jgi:hypothetical protein